MMTQVSGNNDTNSSSVDVFPPFRPNLATKDIKEMDIISNLENTADLEFDNSYINEVIERFSLTPILCHKCNDLSKYFLDPSYHINKKYIENARWVLNANAVNSMDIDPYRSLKLPIFDVSNIGVQHPPNRPMGKIHLVRQPIWNTDRKHQII